MTEYITRDGLLRPLERRYRDVVLPGGLTARLQSLSERERSEWDAGNEDAKGNWSPPRAKEGRRRLLTMALVDGEGKRLLDPLDVQALEELDAVTMRVLWEAAVEHCLGTNLEALKKNLSETSGDDSP